LLVSVQILAEQVVAEDTLMGPEQPVEVASVYSEKLIDVLVVDYFVLEVEALEGFGGFQQERVKVLGEAYIVADGALPEEL